ncbi:putative FtsJ like methyltransferase [Trypanosoma vivax]|uniref:Cap-specific mRNA (nucleoside-2'-O-)-methyltransferase 1 n=1 Tax=Trypanosoma vivax (strain Y486) TaxID=1055687 RepID=G0U777_TRYVY|nr:putative methyltransferase [Trypanosoma vivax]KAH8620624.1 putative FtsJ like methyltransferase [Trypanosoma vivax]CCC51734.1 putative methyltransferase [Trypanosoma vivax Y486]
MVTVADSTEEFPLRHAPARAPPDLGLLPGETHQRVHWRDAYDKLNAEDRLALWAAKSALDNVDYNAYVRVRDALFPLAVSGGECGLGFRNRAGHKLREAMDAADVWEHLKRNVGKHGGPLTFVDICGGPGAFSQALFAIGAQHRMRLRGFGLTLRSDKGLDWYTDLPSRKFFPTYGIDGTGDIFKLENIEALCSLTCKEDVKLVVGDGGFDISMEVANYQETISSRIIYAQWFCAMKLLRHGGCFVLKLFDTFSPFSRAILYLTTYLYENVRIVKPCHSRVVNSERYLVCTGFVGVPTAWLVHFERCFQEGFIDNDGIPVIIPDAWVMEDETFAGDVMQMNSAIALKQVAALRMVLNKLDLPQHSEGVV